MGVRDRLMIWIVNPYTNFIKGCVSFHEWASLCSMYSLYVDLFSAWIVIGITYFAILGDFLHDGDFKVVQSKRHVNAACRHHSEGLPLNLDRRLLHGFQQRLR